MEYWNKLEQEERDQFGDNHEENANMLKRIIAQRNEIHGLEIICDREWDRALGVLETEFRRLHGEEQYLVHFKDFLDKHQYHLGVRQDLQRKVRYLNGDIELEWNLYLRHIFEQAIPCLEKEKQAAAMGNPPSKRPRLFANTIEIHLTPSENASQVPDSQPQYSPGDWHADSLFNSDRLQVDTLLQTDEPGGEGINFMTVHRARMDFEVAAFHNHLSDWYSKFLVRVCNLVQSRNRFCQVEMKEAQGMHDMYQEMNLKVIRECFKVQRDVNLLHEHLSHVQASLKVDSRLTYMQEEYANKVSLLQMALVPFMYDEEPESR